VIGLIQDMEAEMALLGSMLVDPDEAIPRVLEIIPRGNMAFCCKDHQFVFDAVVEMHGNGEAIDLITMEAYLRYHDQLESVGGRNYLLDLASSVPSAASAAHYANIVSEKYRLRNLAAIGSALQQRAQETGASSTDLDSWVTREIQRIDSTGFRPPTTARESAQDLISEILERQDEPAYPTGFSWIDRKLCGGLRGGQYCILAARPGAGKTTLALQIANAWAESGIRVAFYSLEMGAKQLVRRIVSSKLGIPGRVLIRHLGLADHERDELANLELSPNLLIIDHGVNSMSAFAASVQRMVKVEKAQVIVLDYLGLLCHGSERRSRYETMTELSGSMKALTLSLNVPLIAVCQLNREGDVLRPSLRHLRDSGALEQDADVVMLLGLSEEPPDDGPRPPEWGVTLWIEKNREGETGRCDLWFVGQTTTIMDKTERDVVQEAVS